MKQTEIREKKIEHDTKVRRMKDRIQKIAQKLDVNALVRLKNRVEAGTADEKEIKIYNEIQSKLGLVERSA